MKTNENVPVLYIRMSNGEDIIAEVTDTKKTELQLSHAVRVVIDADLDMGKQTIYMYAWMPQGITKENSCIINRKDILFTASLQSDIEEYYKSMTEEIFQEVKPIKLKADKNSKDNSDGKVVSFNKNLNKE